jgi:hypothetical protein
MGSAMRRSTAQFLAGEAGVTALLPTVHKSTESFSQNVSHYCFNNQWEGRLNHKFKAQKEEKHTFSAFWL